jgi:hypothetical protein
MANTKRKSAPAQHKPLRAVETLDITAEQEKCEKAAHQIWGFLNAEGIPEFLTEAMNDALDAASMKAGIPYWQSDEKEGVRLDLRGMSDLIAITKNVRFKIKKEGNAELAAQLSAILKNPACTTALYNCIGETIVNMANDVDPDGADYIERALDAHAADAHAAKEQKRQQKGASS